MLRGLRYDGASLSALAAALLLGLGCAGVGAQDLGDLEGKAKLSAAERAKRDADKVYQWIRFHADKGPAKAKTTAVAEAAPAPAPPARPTPGPTAAVKPAARPAEPAPVLASQAPEDEAMVGPELPLVAASAAASEDGRVLALAVVPQAAAAALALPSSAAARPAAVAEPAEEPLRLIDRVEPEYPAVLLRGRGSGSVLVQFQVQPDGSVQAPEVLKSSNQRLVASVLAAVARWRFAPISKTRVATVEIGFRPPE